MYYKKNVDYVELLCEDLTYQITLKPAFPKLFTVLASPEEPTRKLKRVKRPDKKSFDAPTAGVVIRETLVKSLSKKKEKMTVKKRKGIDLLSEVALTKEAQYEEVYKKSLRDFYKTHPSGSEENKEEIEDDEEEEEKEDEFVKTPSNNTDDKDETKIKDKTKEDEDARMDYTTNQFDNDVNVRLNEPVTSDEGFIQKEGTDVEMTNVQQGNENPESSHRRCSYIPHIDAEIVSPIDVHVYHEVKENQEKDKIGSKPDKNGRRGEVGKCLK
nr:hypothetical protein [Tanacetum cinerariifolium]